MALLDDIKSRFGRSNNDDAHNRSYVDMTMATKKSLMITMIIKKITTTAMTTVTMTRPLDTANMIVAINMSLMRL